MLILCMPLSNYAMEKSNEISPFDALPQETKQHIFLSGIAICTSLKEITTWVKTVKELNTEFNSLVEDPLIMPDIVKDVHKKFNIRKLDARYLIHTRAAQDKLLARIKTITQYAFLHHNDLLHKNGGVDEIRPGSGSFTKYALEHTYKDLHERRKTNSIFWDKAQEIDDIYTIIIQPHPIDCVIDAYNNDMGGQSTSAELLYLSENIDKALKACLLKKYLEEKNLLSLLALNIFTLFIFKRETRATAFNRINPIGK